MNFPAVQIRKLFSPAWLCLGAALVASCSVQKPQRLILITIDTLRWDTFEGRPRSKFMDEILEPDYPGFIGEAPTELVSSMPLTRNWSLAGVRFDRYYSVSPVTQPAHASLFTGQFPWQHGVTRNGQVLDAKCATVPELLRDAGWETAAVVASFPLTRRMGLDQGFDRYLDELDLTRRARMWHGEEVEEFYVLAESITDRALGLLDGFKGSQQFLWVHYFDPHAPYGDTVPDQNSRTLAALQKAVFSAKNIEMARAAITRANRLYELDVRSLDRELFRLLDRLSTEGHEFETHVVLVADHGESFGDDDSLGHGRRLTEAQLRVPLIIHSPRVLPGTRTEAVGSVDVAATLLALGNIGVPLPHGRNLLKTSLGPEWVAGMRTSFEGELEDGRVEGELQKLAGNRWFVFEQETLVSGDRDHAYLDDDESRPAQAELARRSEQLFGLFADQLVGAVDLDDAETRAAMRALGYVDPEAE